VTARVIALALWVATAAQSVAIVVILARSPNLLGATDPFYPLAALTFTSVGSVVATRCPRNAVGWLLAICGIFAAAEALTGTYAATLLATEPGQASLVAWLTQWLWIPALAALVEGLLLFPDGAALSPRWRWAVNFVAVGAVAVVVTAACSPTGEFFRPVVLATAGPGPIVATGWFGVLLANAAPVVPVFVLSCLALVVAALIARYRRSDVMVRAQLKWVAYAAGLLFATIAISPIVMMAVGVDAPLGVALLAVPIAIGIAILRHRLFDIDLLISRTLSYAALTGIVIALYVVAVTYLGALLRQPENTVVSASAALIVAVAFNPVRVRVQRAVDQLVYGQRADPYAVVAELGRRLGAALDPEAVLPTIARTVGDSLRLPYVAIELSGGDGQRIVASHGRARDTVISLPLVYQQQTVGHLLVSPRPGEERLGRQDLIVLDGLGRQAGVAAHGVRVTAELRRARERLVVAREEERRRLLRDLHDELGPRLASHTLLVDAARVALTRDAQRADTLLENLSQETRRSLEEVRRIARGLRPAALDELGLPRALRDAAEQCASSGLAVEVDIADIDSIPTAVETAAYHVAREALANVLRHSGANSCTVRLHRSGSGALVLQVEDDGKGVVAGGPAGVGITSMRERPVEVGGHGVVEVRPGGGTRVTAVFPLRGKV
jgi:two-component system NarL family sensor kinase